jgi:hypothetical protein
VVKPVNRAKSPDLAVLVLAATRKEFTSAFIASKRTRARIGRLWILGVWLDPHPQYRACITTLWVTVAIDREGDCAENL